MSEPTVEAGLFALDPNARIIRGMLLPYGELSRPSVTSEPVMFAAGDIDVPADPSVATLNREHNRFDPIGRAVELEETDAGVLAAFAVAETPEGDAYLAEYAGGRRRRLSAELAVYRDAAGAIVRRVLVGAAVVERGAFAGAALFAELELDPADPAAEPELVDELDPAEPIPGVESGSDVSPAVAEAMATIAAELGVDVDDIALAIRRPEAAPVPGQAGAASTPEPAAYAAAVPAPADAATTGGTPTTESEEPMPEATAPATLGTGTPAGGEATTTLTRGDLFAAIVEHREQGTPIPAEFAAGGDLFALGAATGNLGNVLEPQFVGEVWSGGDYVPKWMQLFAQDTLTSLVVNGWRFVTRPGLAAWAGDGAPVGGTAVTTEPVTEAAQRFAGGNVIPREYYDFNARQFVEAYTKYARDDWHRKADGYVRTQALAAATLTDSDIPAGGEPSLPVIRRIVDGVFAIAKDPINARATFAMIPTADYKLLLHTGHSDLLEYLALALNVESGSALGFHLGWDDAIPAGDVIVGAKQSAKVRTLPGSPIRVNAAAIATGSFDEALFGYVHFLDENPDALVRMRDIA